uniref:Uncharacterized protein n=1 Tax=Triticum urartu TaxID=4572 RepID=A0A8R7QRS8_TRIUA
RLGVPAHGHSRPRHPPASGRGRRRRGRLHLLPRRLLLLARLHARASRLRPAGPSPPPARLGRALRRRRRPPGRRLRDRLLPHAHGQAPPRPPAGAPAAQSRRLHRRPRRPLARAHHRGPRAAPVHARRRRLPAPPHHVPPGGQAEGVPARHERRGVQQRVLLLRRLLHRRGGLVPLHGRGARRRPGLVGLGGPPPRVLRRVRPALPRKALRHHVVLERDRAVIPSETQSCTAGEPCRDCSRSTFRRPRSLYFLPRGVRWKDAARRPAASSLGEWGRMECVGLVATIGLQALRGGSKRQPTP